MVPIMKNDELTDDENRNENIAKLKALLVEGKQAYISNRLKEAEEKLSEAAELSVSIYGYFTTQTFDPHFYYGKTLLELARLEDGVFSNAFQGIATAGEGQNDEKDEEVDPLSEEERADIAEKVGEALECNAETLEEKVASCRVDSSDRLKETDKEDKEVKVDTTNEAMESNGNGAESEQTERDNGAEDEKDEKEGKSDAETEGKEEDKDENMENEENKMEEEEEKDETLEEEGENGVVEKNENKDESNEAEDVEYLQLAWEHLEVARAICDRNLEEEGWKERKVEVLLDLADCSTDAENYQQAIDDIDACIILSESIFEETDRRIAQAYFIKARTHALAKQFENAAKVFGKSKEILEMRLAKLEAELTGKSEKEVEKIKEEICELKSLLPEIQLKIEDSLESAKSLVKKSVDAEEGDNKNVSLGSTMKEVPVDDVSNLIRKKAKRPAEDEPENEAKKTKGDGDAENAAVDSAV